MQARRPELPNFMAGGAKNPLGARAIYLGSTIYRIHGTNEPKSIGRAASSGCIRMLNDDVSELYQFVKLGAEVTVN
jgi:lipoprotein-anchoring transpeptidase ErfK/SrfK